MCRQIYELGVLKNDTLCGKRCRNLIRFNTQKKLCRLFIITTKKILFCLRNIILEVLLGEYCVAQSKRSFTSRDCKETYGKSKVLLSHQKKSNAIQ